ncbi:hypothetical protein BpHYR1_051907 [Brachionus plicatilis]|uniref:Secreted protein n=1 Tax=Brachionus plicatilis TaxID=10195 RepID=A0A3M7RLS6_BRAPC|nr:hypothetical protein BpHYR1_051907 [Brachionus plicatilis]
MMRIFLASPCWLSLIWLLPSSGPLSSTPIEECHHHQFLRLFCPDSTDLKRIKKINVYICLFWVLAKASFCMATSDDCEALVIGCWITPGFN